MQKIATLLVDTVCCYAEVYKRQISSVDGTWQEREEHVTPVYFLACSFFSLRLAVQGGCMCTPLPILSLPPGSAEW